SKTGTATSGECQKLNHPGDQKGEEEANRVDRGGETKNARRPAPQLHAGPCPGGICGTTGAAISVRRNTGQYQHHAGKREKRILVLRDPNQLWHCGDNAGERRASADRYEQRRQSATEQSAKRTEDRQCFENNGSQVHDFFLAIPVTE